MHLSPTIATQYAISRSGRKVCTRLALVAPVRSQEGFSTSEFQRYSISSLWGWETKVQDLLSRGEKTTYRPNPDVSEIVQTRITRHLRLMLRENQDELLREWSTRSVG